MMRILSAEWLKTKRTPIRWVVFLCPAVFSMLIIGYFSLRETSDQTQIFIFEAYFEVLTALIMPIGAGLISGFMIHQEEMAGGLNGFLGSKLPRLHLYIGKLLMLVLLTAASILSATLTLVLGLSFIHISVLWPIFILAGILVVFSIIPLLTFYLWISFAWGMGASIGLGGVGILIAALMATNLGNTVWYYVPWAWPVRFSLLPGAYLLDLTGMTLPPSMISSGYVYTEFIKGIIPAALFFVMVLTGGLIWIHKWEGRKIYE